MYLCSPIPHPHQTFLIRTAHLLSAVRLETSGIIASVFLHTQRYQAAPAVTKSPILPSEGFLWGGRAWTASASPHGRKIWPSHKKGTRMRHYVIITYNELSVCHHDEIRERQKGTVMAFWDDRDTQGSVRQGLEWYRKSLQYCRSHHVSPCALVVFWILEKWTTNFLRLLLCSLLCRLTWL